MTGLPNDALELASTGVSSGARSSTPCSTDRDARAELDGHALEETGGMNPIDWQSMRQQLNPDLEGFTVFVETRDGGLRRIDSEAAESQETIGLAAAWLPEGDIVSSKERAEELLARLRGGPRGTGRDE